jgi:UDP-N-acetylmuramoyl-tripeptide--D-alanyl-D-alanine ligase
MIGKIKDIASAMKGRLYGQGEDAIYNVSTDTRTLHKGDLFIALQGEFHDGHDFLEQACAKGAQALVISDAKLVEKYIEKNVNVILVDDTLLGLQQLANWHRQKFTIPVIGITGSNGKTTTKDMVASVLSEKFNVLKTEGNYNNEIGLPLTLLKIMPEHEVIVLEMGMRGLGEIDVLCQIANPTAGIITNVGVTHYELLGSVENIAKAKGELLEHIPTSGLAMLNGEDNWSRRLSTLCRGKVLFFGFNDKAQVRATNLSEGEVSQFTLEAFGEKVKAQLPLPGEHNILNALSAAGVGLHLGMTLEEVAQGLNKVKISAMRLAKVAGINNTIIINDAYNANPTSTKASLQVLAKTEGGRKIAVLGDMRELGTIEEECHFQAGEFTAELGIDHLVAVGKLGKFMAEGALAAGMTKDHVRFFDSNEGAKVYLRNLLKPYDVILVKGSRAVKMEEIVNFVAQPEGKK